MADVIEFHEAKRKVIALGAATGFTAPCLSPTGTLAGSTFARLNCTFARLNLNGQSMLEHSQLQRG
jgi:hypothetical protein